jgi:putative endonuclease
MQNDRRYYVYILTNFNKNVFYAGVTNDIVKRLIEHRAGAGSQFAKKYQLKYLIYYEIYQSIYEAIAREKEIKGWKREKKLNIIKSRNLNLLDLSDGLFKDYGINEKEVKEYEKESVARYKK